MRAGNRCRGHRQGKGIDQHKRPACFLKDVWVLTRLGRGRVPLLKGWQTMRVEGSVLFPHNPRPNTQEFPQGEP